jgi:predicted site-specific integrase-resolvase
MSFVNTKTAREQLGVGAATLKYNCRIVVLDESKLSPQAELVNDLLSIIHVFSCRVQDSYFRRNRLRKYSRQIREDSDLPEKPTHRP